MPSKFQNWIKARLWRRLMFSHLAVIISGYVVLQLALAALIIFSNDTLLLNSEAAIVARAMAHTAGQLLENEQQAQLPLILELALDGSIALTVPDYKDNMIHIQQEPLALSDGWFIRVTCVHIQENSGAILTQNGFCQTQDSTEQVELLARVQNNESNPADLNRRLSLPDGDLFLGVASIPGEKGEIRGIVVVEMLPSSQTETNLNPAEKTFNFLALVFITSLIFGVPGLIIALALALLSGVITSRSLVRRIGELEDTAQSMAAGALSLRVAEYPPDEIGQAGQAFNNMANQLQNTLGSLEKEKASVESLLRARRDMIANISHDLRTPISTISAYLETLNDNPTRLAEYLAILTSETARLSKLVDDLFELSRIDANELPLTLMSIDLSSVLSKVASTYRSLAWDQHRIVLDYQASPSLPAVWTDVQRLEQILTNLIVNALRHTPEGGIISLEALPLVNTVEIRVTDTGSGISVEDLPHIFERFYRSDPARVYTVDGKSSGSGLGLAIVKGLLNAMGGSISAESIEGEGTCIRFELPQVN